MASLTIAQDPSADRVLSQDPFALLTGMLLDQQFPMERAFAGPAKVLERFGTLEPAAIAAADPEAFADLCATPPAVHRYGRSMAGRIQALAVVVRDEYDGDASAIWSTATTGKELFARLKALPGFGEQKAKIFTALLGKQLAVRPDGWQEVCGAYDVPPPAVHILDRATFSNITEQLRSLYRDTHAPRLKLFEDCFEAELRGSKRPGSDEPDFGADVYGEKNWGTEGFPDSWWWGQAQAFDDGTDACVAPILSVADALAHEHMGARGSILPTSSGGVQPGLAPRFSNHPHAAPGQVAARGADTAAGGETAEV